MSGRERLLAEIEADRCAAMADSAVQDNAPELGIADEDNSYNPYDKPGHAKPLRLDAGVTARRRAFKRKKRRK